MLLTLDDTVFAKEYVLNKNLIFFNTLQTLLGYNEKVTRYSGTKSIIAAYECVAYIVLMHVPTYLYRITPINYISWWRDADTFLLTTTYVFVQMQFE